jgi:hypothetical protein
MLLFNIKQRNEATSKIYQMFNLNYIIVGHFGTKIIYNIIQNRSHINGNN